MSPPGENSFEYLEESFLRKGRMLVGEERQKRRGMYEKCLLNG